MVPGQWKRTPTTPALVGETLIVKDCDEESIVVETKDGIQFAIYAENDGRLLLMEF